MKSLIQLQPDVCKQALVPVLLAAYNATLSKQGKINLLLMLKHSLFKSQPHKMVKYTQTIRRLLPTNCLSVFDHFVGLALKGLTILLVSNMPQT